MRHSALLRGFTLTAFCLCLTVVVLGAYVRLTAAGLGCPDWPGCYGHFSPAGAIEALDPGKAWREMIHRYAASTLGLTIVCITAMGLAWRREKLVSVPYVLALLLAVVVQGAFGMLTVTLRLTPLIVTLHLLFGLTTLSLLWWLLLTLNRRQGGAWKSAAGGRDAGISDTARGVTAARALALTGVVVLALQIALGGWTSSNYAATACPDLPTCQGSFWPDADFRDAYVLWRGLSVNFEGGVLAVPARVAIHLTHRFGALVTTLMLLTAVWVTLRNSADAFARRTAALVVAALALQLAIGIFMVLRGFPLWLATAHNAGAALLLLAVLALNRALRPV
jgi:cytochrome c oxidase assembly protein subunit 15